MHGITAHDLSSHFTRLVGRRVGFEQGAQFAAAITKPIYGVYKSFPSGDPILLEVDLRLIGSLAGAFIGIPDSEISRRTDGPNLDEVLQDAITEIFNVAASAVSREDRAVFVSMFRKRADLPPDIAPFLAKPPHHQFAFRVSVEAYTGGIFKVLL